MLKKLKAAVQQFALELSYIKGKQEKNRYFLLLIKNLRIHWFELKNHWPIRYKLKTEALVISQYHKMTKN